MEHKKPANERRLRNVSLASAGNAQHVVELEQQNTDMVIARLPIILQKSLILEDMLDAFQAELQKVLVFDSFHFQNTAMEIDIAIDTQSHHRCHYKLDINDEYLGDITLTRRSRFANNEINLLETVLSTIVYPLKNCLLYKRAITSSTHDPLTGLGNRTAYEAALERETDLCKRHNTPLSMIVMDIDDFKKINDSYGHSYGDLALKALAKTTVKTMRRSDIAFRYGGEEFVLLLNSTDLDAAKIAAERIRCAVSQTLCEKDGTQFGYTISLGVAEMKEGETTSELFDRADSAMYQAKQAGKNKVIGAE